jgi:hypothetical protein
MAALPEKRPKTLTPSRLEAFGTAFLQPPDHSGCGQQRAYRIGKGGMLHFLARGAPIGIKVQQDGVTMGLSTGELSL